MQFVIVLLIAAAVFGVCYLVDKGFTKAFRGKAQHRSGMAVRANKRFGVFGVVLTVLGVFAVCIGIGDGPVLIVGGLIVLLLMGVPPVVYWSHVVASSTCLGISIGLAKSVLFGLLVGLIGCACGLRTRNTADGVGAAATSAVVGGIVAIAVSDGVLAVVCYVLGI